MEQKIRAEDIAVYIFAEAVAIPREKRLTQAAALYAARCGLIAGGFTVARAEGGKPYFPQHPELHFSISHSGAYWLAAFHGAPLGLDIQQHKPIDYLRLARRWFHPLEYELVRVQGPACFFALWCAKESYCKHSGAGILSTMPGFSLAAGYGEKRWACNGLHLKPLALFEHYSACLCAKNIAEIYIETLF